MMAYLRCFELLHYYDSITDYTFPTRFVAVSLPAARAWRVWNSGREPVIDEDATALQQLRVDVAAAVAEMAGEEDRCFV